MDSRETEILVMETGPGLFNVSHKTIVAMLECRDPLIALHLVEEGSHLDQISTHLSFAMLLCGPEVGISETSRTDRSMIGLGLTSSQIIEDRMIVLLIRDIEMTTLLNLTDSVGEYTVNHQITIVHLELSKGGLVLIMSLKLVLPLKNAETL